MTSVTRSTQTVLEPDTIVALSTPPGRGAIAVVRVSGARAFEIAERHVAPWPRDARALQLCDVRDETGLLDRALVTFYQAPESFTGENVVEIFTHGGRLVPVSVVAALIGSGAREANPGEFTRRAVINGKLDIVQAEATGDLIDARSRAMQRAALYQLDGGLSSRIAAVRNSVLHLEALIAYDVDFPEEDDGPIARTQVDEAIKSLLSRLDLLLSTIPVGQMIRDGAIVVIAGEPNVGKSSLFNALLGESRAIVTAIPGTTRDAIEAVMDAGEWPIRLIDTAGLRESTDIVERLGIETSERHITVAHLVIVCGDSDASLARAAAVVSQLTTAPILEVRTKSDLRGEVDTNRGIGVSAATGENLGRLQGEIGRVLREVYGEIAPELPVLTRARQIDAITRARAEVGEFGEAWDSRSLPIPIAAVHLRAAAVSLEDVIGAVSTEDVLDRVFSSFCVGK